jgi:hypothetical protein
MRGVRCLSRCSFCSHLLTISGYLVFAFADLYIYIYYFIYTGKTSKSVTTAQSAPIHHSNPWGSGQKWRAAVAGHIRLTGKKSSNFLYYLIAVEHQDQQQEAVEVLDCILSLFGHGSPACCRSSTSL